MQGNSSPTFLGLGTARRSMAIIAGRSRSRFNSNTVLFAIVQVGALVVDLRVPVIELIELDTVLFGETNTVVTSTDYQRKG